MDITYILDKARALVEAAYQLSDDANTDALLEDTFSSITEAIDLYEDDVEEDVLSESTIEVVNEAIDRLYEQAAACDSCCDAEKYIQKATELQAAISDIPEEKPEEDDEYPADTIIGGEEEDLECIKDLVNGDEEAIDILTKDDSVIIDA